VVGPTPPPCGNGRRTQLINPSQPVRYGSRIQCSTPVAPEGRTDTEPVKCEQFIRRRPRVNENGDERCPLILDGLCLHVLSSFQRTGVPPSAPPSRTEKRPKGNLSNLRQLL
jgi:hypothetical protein